MLVMATSHGKRLAKQERLAAPLLAEVTGEQVIYTPRRSAALVDGLIVRGDEITAVFELKCRNLTVEKLRSYDNKWMLNTAKVERCAKVARMLSVPLYGALYLVPDGVLYWIPLANEKGELVEKFETKKQRTTVHSLSKRWVDEEVYLIPVE